MYYVDNVRRVRRLLTIYITMFDYLILFLFSL